MGGSTSEDYAVSSGPKQAPIDTQPRSGRLAALGTPMVPLKSRMWNWNE